MIDEEKKQPQEVLSDEDAELGFDPKILETVDLKLSPSFELDIMAAELLEHLANYHKAKAAVKAARHQGDHARAEQMYKLMKFSKMAGAVIQSDFPGAKALADQIGEVRAKQARLNRLALMNQPEEE